MALFGTDGIRGVAGLPPLDRASVVRFGHVLARHLPGAAPLLIAGGDTRASTVELASWVALGFEAEGGRFVWGGVLPSPAVARLVTDREADAGLVISASHNLPPDNGLKLFDRQGFKWSQAEEQLLEQALARADDGARGTAASIRCPPVDRTLEPRYLERLRSTVPSGDPLAGLSVAIDAANGAASSIAVPLFEGLGATVTARGIEPDGHNINRGCGSTAPQGLAALCVETGCDLGIAFDGDADRVVLCDERGLIQDGDALLYLWATSLAERGELDPPAIVATTMSNGGLRRSLQARGIEVRECGVGDRQVVETLRASELVLGGEQSGHLVHLGLATTGDGLLTALHLAWLVARHDEPLSSLLAGFTRLPQTLHNVRVNRRPPLDSLVEVSRTLRSVEERLGPDGRLMVRYSGTEPLARIMVEGPELDLIERAATEVAAAIRREIGESPS